MFLRRRPNLFDSWLTQIRHSAIQVASDLFCSGRARLLNWFACLAGRPAIFAHSSFKKKSRNPAVTRVHDARSHRGDRRPAYNFRRRFAPPTGRRLLPMPHRIRTSSSLSCTSPDIVRLDILTTNSARRQRRDCALP